MVMPPPCGVVWRQLSGGAQALSTHSRRAVAGRLREGLIATIFSDARSGCGADNRTMPDTTMPADPDRKAGTPQALAAIRVLDLSRVLAGPWCTQVLADLGADVIKVERPRGPDHPGGDDTRGWGPPFLRDRAGRETAEAAYFLGANRNKRSITIDIAKPAGADLVRKLAAKCDVLVENFKVGDMGRHGLDAPSLLALQPRLVYCSITGFGQTGPYRDRAGYDYAVQGLGGLMSVTGPSRAEIADDAPGGGPQKVGVAVADLFTGMYAVAAILAALRHRDATGQGQAIDMALLDTQVAMLANLGAGYLATGVAPQRAGNAHQNIVPYQVFEVADGHLILAVGNDAQFARFCAVAGRPELASDPRFAVNSARVRHRETLVPLLAAVLRERSRAVWLAALEAAKVPCGPINDLAEVFADPQVRSRAMTVELAHPLAGAIRVVASPLKMSQTPVQYLRAPPLLGADTEAVLGELGLDAAEIADLRTAGVI
jgi:crotonobetainyl-CoA:carnitine CoA-transferase CaiB-like acyl-CoA transferase